MITKKFLDEILLIDKNLKVHFDRYNQSEVENILSRTVKLSEEVGELSSDILKKFYKRRDSNIKEENLELEIADVMITLSLLAKSLNIDLNQAIEKKFNIIKKRGGI